MGFVDHNFAGWQSPNARSRWFPDRCDILINYADQYLGKRIERASPNTYSLYLQIRAEIESRVNNKAWNSLNCQFLHGDPSPENCLWKSDTQTPLWIDLDDARWGFRIWDLARCAVELAAIKPRKPHEVAILRSDWDLETLSLLLDGFESVLPLDNCEKVMLPECLVLASVAVIIALLDLDETELQTPDEITCICRSLLHLINTIPAIESFRKI
jgi:Ser/Thr protein kinase RdoA (MazF antagonist)